MVSSFPGAAYLIDQAIIQYQRRISPVKKFACAHRIAHGGRSCSGHARRLLQRCGIVAAALLMRRRFARCGAAARALAAQKKVLDYESPNSRRRGHPYPHRDAACGPGVASPIDDETAAQIIGCCAEGACSMMASGL
jgi:putative component of membrane protein insertase Oxa1/YidC/SpoIIIJ protein YidD